MVPESLTDEQFKENENIVVYSGGCDSTLVLYKVCERAKKLGKGVYVLCIDSEECATSAEHYMEERARDIFIEYMRKRGVEIRDWEKSFKPCNECHSCRTHIMALKEIDKTWTHLELRKLGVK